MRRALLGLSALFLALSADRLTPDLPPAAEGFSVISAAAAARAWPPRNAGRFGRPGDPLSLAFVGTPEAVRAALTAAGWTEVPTSLRASLAAGAAELLAGRRLAAFPPMNDYRVAGRRQDMNWARPIRPLQERHHFRLWRTGARDACGRDLWWGSGNYDLSIRWRDFSHVPDPDVTRERAFILETLAGSAGVESAALTDVPQVPREGANDKSYAFRGDGRAALIVLR